MSKILQYKQRSRIVWCMTGSTEPTPPHPQTPEPMQGGGEIITEPITDAEEAYDRIIEDAAARAMKLLGKQATDIDALWMTSTALVSFRLAPETLQWTPVAVLDENAPPDLISLGDIPAAQKKDIRDGYWFAMLEPSIPPELATVARDYAYFAALGWVAQRIGAPGESLMLQLTQQPDSFAQRAVLRYSTFMRTGGIV